MLGRSPAESCIDTVDTRRTITSATVLSRVARPATMKCRTSYSVMMPASLVSSRTGIWEMPWLLKRSTASPSFSLTLAVMTATFYAAWDGSTATLPLLLNKFISAYFILDVLIYCGIVGASHAHRFYEEAKTRELAASRLQESLTQARLAALRGQLNPHFLFNTLNAVATMALKREHDNVVVTLGYLSELLRVSLDERLPQEVPLADELDLLERYLEIQRIRFGDRLTVTRDIDDDVLGALVPIMILQPLAENAIVHGIAPVPGPGEMRLRAERRDGELLLEISDSGPGFGSVARLTACRAHQEDQTGDDGRSSTGIGLANTRARIAQLYGERAVLWVGAGDAGGARVTVTIPFRAAPPSASHPTMERVAG